MYITAASPILLRHVNHPNLNQKRKAMKAVDWLKGKPFNKVKHDAQAWGILVSPT